MSEDDGNEASGGENAADKAGDVRKTRGIRFPESEWEEVKRAALATKSPSPAARPQAHPRARAEPWGGARIGRRRASNRPRLRVRWRRRSSGCSAAPGSWRPKGGTRWFAKAAGTSLKSWSPRPGPSRNRSAGTPPTEGIRFPPDRLRDSNPRNPAHVARVSVADSGRQYLEWRRDRRVSVRMPIPGPRVSVRVSVGDTDRQGHARPMRNRVYRTDTRSILQERDAGRRPRAAKECRKARFARACAHPQPAASGVRPKARPGGSEA